ncbi:MAG: hypothetical protein EOP39_04395 [Rubrivivax sp.]|nr:MAG: hypothetical protein EOP39_04395 [Rubrivivax sp.]
MNEGLKAVMAVIGLIAASIFGAVWGGYVFSVLWAWFIVSAFAAPALGVAQAIGVTMAARFTLRSWSMRKQEDDSDVGKTMAAHLFGPLLFLAVGWIVKQWLPA